MKQFAWFKLLILFSKPLSSDLADANPNRLDYLSYLSEPSLHACSILAYIPYIPYAQNEHKLTAELWPNLTLIS